MFSSYHSTVAALADLFDEHVVVSNWVLLIKLGLPGTIVVRLVVHLLVLAGIGLVVIEHLTVSADGGLRIRLADDWI